MTKIVCPECGGTVGQVTDEAGRPTYTARLISAAFRGQERQLAGSEAVPWSMFSMTVSIPLDPVGMEELRDLQRDLIYERMPSETIGTCREHGMIAADLGSLDLSRKRIPGAVVRRW